MTKDEIDELRKRDPALLTPKQKGLLNLVAPVKGEVRNPNGRTPGTVTLKTKATKELLALAAADNLPAVNAALDRLLKSDNDATAALGVNLFLRMLEFSQPKLSAVAVKTDGNAGVIIIGKPTELELPSNVEDKRQQEETDTNHNIEDISHDVV